jgi:alpha-beta hydrolase superfamily lysophospholipase
MEELYFDNGTGNRLYGRLFEADSAKAALIGVHGFGDHSGGQVELAEYLQKAGISVFSFDLRGAGKSPGTRMYVEKWSDYLDDVSAALNLFAEKHKELPLFLFGHSMGGAIVLDYGLHYPGTCKGIISSAPGLGSSGANPVVVVLAKILGSLLPKLSMKVGLEEDNISRDKAYVQEFLNDPLRTGKGTTRWGAEFLKAQKAISAGKAAFKEPLLLLYGDADVIIPQKLVEEFYTEAASEDKTLKVFPGGYHDLQHDPCKIEVFDLFRDWIINRV